MPTVRQFEDLNVWQDARRMVAAICLASKTRSFNQDSGLREQIRRAAVSTMSNMAEGFERGSRKEFVQYLDIAKGPNGEVRSQLCVALDQKYMGENEFDSLRDLSVTLSKKLAVFIRYLEGYAANSRVKKPVRSAANLQLSTGNVQP